MFGQIKGKLEFFQFPFYLAEKAGRKEKVMQIRDGPKENCREKSDHERRTCTWKKTGRKDGWRVRWLLLCAALRSCRRELLQYPPLRWRFRTERDADRGTDRNTDRNADGEKRGGTDRGNRC